MHFDKNVDVRADGIADGLDEGDDAALSRALDLVEAGPEGVELERVIAAFDHTGGGGVELVRRAFHRVPAIGIGPDLVAHRAAEQAVDGLAERLADDVPARDLDEGDAGHDDLAGAAEVLQSHTMDEGLDLEGICAENIAGHGFGEIADDGLRAIEGADVGDAGEALVGFDFDEGDVAPVGAHGHGRDVRDLHVAGVRFAERAIPE